MVLPVQIMICLAFPGGKVPAKPGIEAKRTVDKSCASTGEVARVSGSESAEPFPFGVTPLCGRYGSDAHLRIDERRKGNKVACVSRSDTVHLSNYLTCNQSEYCKCFV